MKIKVNDIMPNPFRKIESYPIDRVKVEDLKQSIEDNTFWENLIVRKSSVMKDKFEIPYGHHRLVALRELNIKEIDNIPVKDFDDVTMIKCMADENIDSWNTKPAVIIQTILVVKDFLDSELAKYESWKSMQKGIINDSINAVKKGKTELVDIIKNRSYLINLLDKNLSEYKFKEMQKNGVGQTTILKFLNGSRKEGKWKQWVIQQALDTLKLSKEGVVDIEAIEEFETTSDAEKFKKAVVEEKIPKKQQKRLAKEIVKSGVGKRGIGEKVREAAQANLPQKSKKKKEKEKVVPGVPDIDEFVENIAYECDSLAADLEKVIGYVDYVKSESVRNMYYGGLKRLKEVIEKSETQTKKELMEKEIEL